MIVEVKSSNILSLDYDEDKEILELQRKEEEAMREMSRSESPA